MMTRRNVMAAGAAAVVGAAFARVAAGQPEGTPKPDEKPSPAGKHVQPLFLISLAEWSLHRAIESGKMTNLDFARVAKEDYAIDCIEYVNTFFNKRTDAEYLKQLNQQAKDRGVSQGLIMCDGEGDLGDPDEAKRVRAVDNHKKWVESAKTLECHSIRVNAASKGAFEEQQKLAADGLRRLVEFGDTHKINVIVENHGGLTSHGDWLAGVMKLVDHPRVGTLPDFGNFYEYDRYKGVAEMMPYAKAVSAKSHVFDKDGNEAEIDYRRMMKIVVDAGYHGRLGIEYEGEKHSEPEGIRLTKALLEKVRDEMGAASRK